MDQPEISHSFKSFSLTDLDGIIPLLRGADCSAVEKALLADSPDIAGLAALLSPAAGELLPELARRSAELTSRRFGRVIQLYAPIYLSNYCGNRCAYCGFSADHRIKRRVLSIEEAEAEALLLARRGYQHILLVSGEAPGRLGVDYLEELSRRLRDSFAAISLEVQPLSEEEYRKLFAAGITGVALYQETYDPVVYNEVHLAGPKADYAFRLAGPARIAGAGMREVGIGFLLGLADWRIEALSLGLHLAWLRHHYWQTAITVSFPRLRPAAGGFSPRIEVDERQLAQLIFALRIFDPDVGLVLSTREESRFRDGMIGLGPTRYSAGSCTSPGGYSEPEQAEEQFSIGDLRSLSEVCRAIRSKGHDPVLKDWDSILQVIYPGVQRPI